MAEQDQFPLNNTVDLLIRRFEETCAEIKSSYALNEIRTDLAQALDDVLGQLNTPTFGAGRDDAGGEEQDLCQLLSPEDSRPAGETQDCHHERQPPAEGDPTNAPDPAQASHCDSTSCQTEFPHQPVPLLEMGSSMKNSWEAIKGIITSRSEPISHPNGVTAESHLSPTEDSPPSHKQDRLETMRKDISALLDVIGQEDETTRSQIARISERLDEISTLKDEFIELIQPLGDLITDYPRVRSKLLNLDVILEQERLSSAALKTELRSLAMERTRLADDLASSNSQVQNLSMMMRDCEEQVENLRLETRSREIRIKDLEKELLHAREEAGTLVSENQTLRKEVHDADRSIVRLKLDLNSLQETIQLAEHGQQALQANIDEQAKKIALLDSKNGQLEQQLSVARQAEADLSSKLAATQMARQTLEAQLEEERASFRSDLSHVEMKLEGANSRLAATEQVLAQTREELRTRTDELTETQRAAKDAATQNGLLERKLEALQQEFGAQTQLLEDAEKARSELSQQCDMLTKAVAAKTGMIEVAERRAQTLQERLEQVTQEFDRERRTLESENKRLLEELTATRSERALLQGALEVARRARSQNERGQPKGQAEGSGDKLEKEDQSPEDKVAVTVTADSNVTPLPGKNRGSLPG